ncbi:MAG: aliphatic sulfonate ABC transporter substrate-binding protein [Candidatus Omnitrophica bacterium]|nr:aliphatic sulfonate ABC transporter substrate-binding protein [Candidatus Omnitrophota bacterium]
MSRLKKIIIAIMAILTIGIKSSCAEEKLNVVKLDYANYNPVSLVLKEKGFLEEDLSRDGIKVEWVLSQGSNKALEALNSKTVDFASAAGAAAFISRAKDNPVKSIYVFSKPEWTALVTLNKSGIKTVADLKGKKVAATLGTDPFVFLVRALAEDGMTLKDIQFVALQHADGKDALLRGEVDAWAGLDPLLAQAEVDNGAILFHRDADLNTYGLLNTREDFIQNHPGMITRVLQAYEKARLWAIANPLEFKTLFEAQAKVTGPVAEKVLGERTDISDSKIGEIQKSVIAAAGEVLKKNGVIADTVDVTKVVNELIVPEYAQEAVK